MSSVSDVFFSPGAPTTPDDAYQQCQAVNIMAAYHRFAPEPMRSHLSDVLSSQKNATLLWTITPPPDEMQRVLGCLK